MTKVTMSQPKFVQPTAEFRNGWMITVQEVTGSQRGVDVYGDDIEEAEANAFYAATSAYTREVEVI